MPRRLVFMGSPDFALPTLQALYEQYEVAGVVTQPDRPAGRGKTMQPCAVKALAATLRLPVYQPVSLKSEEAYRVISEWNPDFIVVVAFGEIIPKAMLSLPPHACLNVHASLLPRWRGASPIQAAIAAGDAKTGVTIMQMDAGLDTGAILSQREVPLRPGTNAGELSDQLAFLGAKSLMDLLPSYLNGKLVAVPQPEAGATYAPKLSKEDGCLDLSRAAGILARRVDAFQPWPGTFLELLKGRLKVLKAHAHDSYDVQQGMRYVVNGYPAIGTAESLLVLDKVQPEGKKAVDGRDFLNGQKDWLG
ncbi:MAG: methionyl-tRNA formyltransferase [Anaerolineaceae bacterium]|nr:methionyl-tRNA formyltransferase [Anaerolineaceae bacterium]